MSECIFDIICASTEDTEHAGRSLAEYITVTGAPRFVALCGGLGAGKTAFVRGFCSRICPGCRVKSPSFAIVNEYRGNPDVYHFDVWRITDEDDLYSTGFYDYAERPGITLCEWADNVEYALPDRYIRVDISGSGDEPRQVTANLKIRGESI